jgi:hypothetical protein
MLGRSRPAGATTSPVLLRALRILAGGDDVADVALWHTDDLQRLSGLRLATCSQGRTEACPKKEIQHGALPGSR